MEPAQALLLAWTSAGVPQDTAAPELAAVVAAPAPAEPLAAGLLAIVTPIAEIEPQLTPAPQPRRSQRSRHRTRRPAAAPVETTAAPAIEPERTTPPERKPASAAQLLRAGEDALADGDAEQAYQLAKRSHRARSHEDAASLVARSACRIGETDAAKHALKELPLLGRSAVRRDCRRSGSRIGL
jgi:hypothetical protein